jgi:hypothetical protein
VTARLSRARLGRLHVSDPSEVGGFLNVKKLLVLAVLGIGAFAVWRKVQGDRAELNMWTEATAIDAN